MDAKRACTAAAAMMLGGCATTGSTPPATETISYSVTPCHGTCPVYSAEVTSTGAIAFDGRQYTVVQGERRLRGTPAQYQDVANALSSYRPAPGTTAQTQCEQQATDQQTYSIVWTAADGSRTTLNHDRGCRSARNALLNSLMDQIPRTLGIQGFIAR